MCFSSCKIESPTSCFMPLLTIACAKMVAVLGCYHLIPLPPHKKSKMSSFKMLWRCVVNKNSTIWVFPKIVGFSPQIIYFWNGVFPLFSPSIFGGKIPLFWGKPTISTLGSTGSRGTITCHIIRLGRSLSNQLHASIFHLSRDLIRSTLKVRWLVGWLVVYKNWINSKGSTDPRWVANLSSQGITGSPNLLNEHSSQTPIKHRNKKNIQVIS